MLGAQKHDPASVAQPGKRPEFTRSDLRRGGSPERQPQQIRVQQEGRHHQAGPRLVQPAALPWRLRLHPADLLGRWRPAGRSSDDERGDLPRMRDRSAAGGNVQDDR